MIHNERVTILLLGTRFSECFSEAFSINLKQVLLLAHGIKDYTKLYLVVLF